jgi:hypothetical protein
MKQICCELFCGKPANFVITNTSAGADPYDYTEACTKHVGSCLVSNDLENIPNSFEIQYIRS